MSDQCRMAQEAACENDATLAALLGDDMQTSATDRVTLGAGARTKVCESDAMIAAMLAEGVQASGEDRATVNVLLRDHVSTAQHSLVGGHFLEQYDHASSRSNGFSSGARTKLCENDAMIAVLLADETQAVVDHVLAQTMSEQEQHSPCHEIRDHDLQPSQLLPHPPSQPGPMQLSSSLDVSQPQLPLQNDSEQECAVCMESSANSCLIPCGHTDLCMQCAGQLNPKLCPICRQPVEGAIQIVVRRAPAE